MTGIKAEAKPLVSVVVPAYNEAPLVEKNLCRLCQYLESLEDEYRWEIIFVNDGSTDETGRLADEFARSRDKVCVFHHRINFQLGQALRFAFNNCRGDYIVTVDLDLSYSPEHIGRLLKTIRETRAKIVIPSPYLKGGRLSNVPFLRKVLSRWANRFLSITSKGLNSRGKLTTLTGMVRAYDARFLRTLDLSSMSMDVNLEIIHKALLLNARIEEIPAHLDWSSVRAWGLRRKSKMRMMQNIVSCLGTGIIFRPFLFFILPGLAILLLSFYHFTWVFILILKNLQRFSSSTSLADSRLSAAVAAAFSQGPHLFFIAGFTLLVAFQFIGLGILAIQSKRYFEELFHLGTSVYKEVKSGK